MPDEIDDREFGIIIPKTDNSGNAIRKDELESFAKRMARQFGGSNTEEFIGCWKDKGEIVCEKNLQIWSIRDTEFRDDWTVNKDKPPKEQFEEDEEFLSGMREKVNDKLGQAVAFSTESKTESVTSIGEEKPTAKENMIMKKLKGHSIDLSEHL